jgi:hypothetical protein
MFLKYKINTTLLTVVNANPTGTDVMILKIFSPKKIGEKIGFFDSKQS